MIVKIVEFFFLSDDCINEELVYRYFFFCLYFFVKMFIFLFIFVNGVKMYCGYFFQSLIMMKSFFLVGVN